MVQILENNKGDKMKKITMTLLGSLMFFTGCTASQVSNVTPEKSHEDFLKIDTKITCNVEKNGISKVLEEAKKYNKIAKTEGLEYRRLSVNNSDLIIAVEEGIKKGLKIVNPKTFKGKKSKTKLEINFAAERSCKFAIDALQTYLESKKTWRNAVPGKTLKVFN